MAQAFPPDEPESGQDPDREPGDRSGDAYDELPDAYVARSVHELEQVVTASRRTIAIRYAAHGVTFPVLPTLDHAELMVLTALVQT